jgi:hypothetical protein
MIYAIICSRRNKQAKELDKLIYYFTSLNIQYHIEYDSKSMFEGYKTGLEKLNPGKEEFVILCHDDIEILSDRNDFREIFKEYLFDKKVGFIGPAGTTYLGPDAVWWDGKRRQDGLHSGFVFQGNDTKTMGPNYFGPCRNVVALDGLFLAARREVLDEINLDKPKEFPHNWDFYDLYYTLTAYEKGYFNKTVPILIRHVSNGEMRGEWYENRRAFQRMFKLPVWCK